MTEAKTGDNMNTDGKATKNEGSGSGNIARPSLEYVALEPTDSMKRVALVLADYPPLFLTARLYLLSRAEIRMFCSQV